MLRQRVRYQWGYTDALSFGGERDQSSRLICRWSRGMCKTALKRKLYMSYVLLVLVSLSLSILVVSPFTVKRDPLIRSSFVQGNFEPSSLSGTVNIAECPNNFSSPVSGAHQKCCKFFKYKPDKVSCLPSLVILGAQKSGTTGLHGYLLLHKNILPSKKKELHLFDYRENVAPVNRRIAGLLPLMGENETDNYITVDNTPSYIADIGACKTLSAWLSRDTRYVVILREPIARVWSEIKMKRRRLLFQQEFLNEVLPGNVEHFKRCVDTRPLEKFKACLPQHVASHGRTQSFFSFLTKRSKEELDVFKKECLGSSSNMSSCIHGRFSGKILTEKMPDIDKVIMEEISRLKIKLDECYYSKGARARVGGLRSRDGVQDAWKVQSLAFKCLPHGVMMSDISKNYIWRSLYHPQLEICISTLGRRNILVIDYAQLVKNPETTVKAIYKHVGLAIPERLSADDARNAFESLYPDFGTVSGWAKHPLEQNDKMPESLHQILSEFFRPYNRRLFKLLGVPPFKGWGV